MYGADEFGPDFQRVLVRACVDDPGLREIVSRFSRAGQLAFSDPASSWAWRLIADEAYPTMLMIQTEARRITPTDPARMGVEAILTARDVRDHDYTTSQIVEWAKRQLFATAFEEARQSWNAGNHDKARSEMLTRIHEISSIAMESVDRGWFFTDFDKRQERRAFVAAGMDSFPTGCDRLDRRMYGGLSYGELGVVVAYSKIGKSFWLNQMGFICARLRRRCAHYVLEGGRSKCEDRYEAAFTRSMFGEVRRGDFTTEVMRHARREYHRLRGNLMIRGWADREDWAVTPDNILADLALLRQEDGWVPDMIVIDYGDLLDAPGESPFQKQKTAFRMLKTLSGRKEGRRDRGYAVWTASQAVRPHKGADVKQHVIKPRDIADCYEKVRVADAILSINRTLAEKKQKIARVYLGAYRDAEDDLLIHASTDYDHGSFLELGAPEPKPETERAQ